MIAITITPTPVSAGLPDAELDVIVWLQDGTSTLGGIDQSGWVDAGGMPFAQQGDRVVAWAPFPAAAMEAA